MGSNISRRTFMQTTSAAGSFGAAAALLTAPARAQGANERIRIGIIGPGRRGFGTHVKSLVNLLKGGANIELAAVNDVYSVYLDRAVEFITRETDVAPTVYDDYRRMLEDDELDAVSIATPDHWHAKQTVDALLSGKHVYCEKPMTHTINEAREVVDVWKSSGLVLQVGVQSTSSPIWDIAREQINAGRLGKVVQFQTESARNSIAGMSRHNEIAREMTPANIDWRQWLGVEEGLAPEMVFDRSTFGQWRCYWPFSMGMFGDLFVHRVTGLLKATGLRNPGRVVGGGGIFMEYDDRDVPDVGSLIADFHEGVQCHVSSTMVSEEEKLQHIIRGHHGLMLFHKKSYLNGPDAAFDFIPERPQVTLHSSAERETVEARTDAGLNFNEAHFANFFDAIRADDPSLVNNDPELGAAAVMIVNLAIRSYRKGKVFHIDRNGRISDGDGSWSAGWEEMSQAKAEPRHVPGWNAGEKGSTFVPHEYQQWAGPWIDGKPPEQT